MDGAQPFETGFEALCRLKSEPSTRHIPVQLLTLDEDRHHGLARGAFAFVSKPTTAEGLDAALSRIKEYAKPHRKHLLVVEDNDAERLGITDLLGHDDIDIVTAGTGSEALTALGEHQFDCVVLDLRLPDMSGFEVLERIKEGNGRPDVPVVVFSGKELSADDHARLRTLARRLVVAT